MSWSAVGKLAEDPGKTLSYLVGMASLLLKRSDSRLRIGRAIKPFGRPIIDIRGRSSITIGDNVTLNSRNIGYFGAMFSPVKLFTDQDDAAIVIGNNTRIHGSCLHAYRRIEVGANCLIAANTVILDSDGHDLSPERPEERLTGHPEGVPVIIEDNVWIGMNCIILKGVRIGSGSVVGAGSVVRKDVPPRTIVAGNPATVVKTFAS